jgi:hypothetical protein
MMLLLYNIHHTIVDVVHVHYHHRSSAQRQQGIMVVDDDKLFESIAGDVHLVPQ